MNDEWPNEQDAALMQQEWEAEQQAYADIERMAQEWQSRWPNHCRACGAWGASPIRHYHYMEPPDGGDPCEALPEGRCHRCGCELTQPDDPCELGTCKTCGWRFDDGAPSWLKPVEHFYVGLNNPSFAWAFSHSMLSINGLRRRKRDFRVNRWILDSGAFTEISTHGRWRHDSDEYIELIHRWSTVGQLDAAVSQDMMCEPDILAKTGLSIAEHQENTIIRYNEISQWVDVYVMPVLQGYSPASYVDHVRQYGKLLKHGQWVGVGSVCKRNGNPDAVEDVLLAIKRERPDLRLHGFGIKVSALKRGTVRALLHSSDSMAWSLAGRKQRRNAHDPRRAVAYVDHMHAILKQPGFVQAQFHQLTTTNNET